MTDVFSERRDSSLSLRTAATTYSRIRFRPSPAALAWLLRGNEWRVLDLAAGTGRVTSQLIPRGLTVVAVEPDEQTRAVFGTQFPGIECLDGTAELIPLPDDSLDAVVVGKAWHLFDPPRALAEISRTLRTGGRLGVFATSMDTRVDWVRDMFTDDSLHAQQRGADSFRNVTLPPEDFSPAGETVFRSTQSMDVTDIVAWFKTRGMYREADEHGQQLVEDRIAEALHGAFPDKSTVEIPVMTLCWRTERQPRALDAGLTPVPSAETTGA